MWRVIMIIKEPIYIMANYLDFFGGKQKKSIDELRQTVENYMKFTVNGDNFSNEQDFEDDVRNMLEGADFIVLEKHNVENTQAIGRQLFSENMKSKIPDISVLCAEGLVFLELKYCSTPAMYEADMEKAAKYLEEGECEAAGVLFMDTTQYQGWKRCLRSFRNKYYYYWELANR